MANDATKALMSRIDTATTGIADRIRRIKGTVAVGMTQAEVDEVNAGLDAEATKLEGIASDPDNPVPVDPPVDPNAPPANAGATRQATARGTRPTD